MVAATSAAFERFRFSFFEDANSARDGLDIAALAALKGQEITRAEDLLIGFLPDTRAVIGLGELRTRRAKPRLVQLFETERRMQREGRAAGNGVGVAAGLVYLAKALWRICPDPRWLEAVIDVLGTAEDWTQRMEAAIALHDVCDAAAVRALTEALDDPLSLVRYHAARALLAIYGLPAEPEGSEHMIVRLMADDTARRQGGKREVLAAIARRPIRTP